MTNKKKHSTFNIYMKKALGLLTPAVAYLGLASSSFAQATINTCPTGQFFNLCNFSITGNFIPGLISLLFIVAIIIAIIYLIWGGIKWIMSGGDKAALQAAREHVIAAIIGLVVVFLVYFLVNFVMSQFVGQNTGSFTLPKL